MHTHRCYTLTDIHKLDVLCSNETQCCTQVLDALGLDLGVLVVAPDILATCTLKLVQQVDKKKPVFEISLQVLDLSLSNLEVAPEAVIEPVGESPLLDFLPTVIAFEGHPPLQGFFTGVSFRLLF